MKKFTLCAILGCMSLFILSCDKKEVEPAGEEFSDLTVEQNKANLEDNGIEFINSMNDFRDGESLDAVTNLVELLSNLQNEEGGRFKSNLLTTLSLVEQGKASASDVFSAMKLNDTPPTGEPETIQEFFDLYAGTYNWVSSTEEWDYTAGGNDVIFNFPASESATTNNASFSITDYEGVEISNPLDEEYSGDLPLNVVFNLEVDNTAVMDFLFEATYNNNGEPTSLAILLNVDPYSFSISQSNNTSNVAVDFSFKKSTTTLIGFSASANGNFNDVGDAEDIEVDNVIHNGTASFQAMNIKIAGSIDVKNLVPELDAIDYTNEDEAVKKEVELLNKYYDLAVYYADSNTKIAETEFYTYPGTEWDYNPNTGNYEEMEVLYMDVRLIFADDSRADFETYFDTGFDDLISAYEDYIDSL